MIDKEADSRGVSDGARSCGCGRGTSRRELLGQVSAAALAAMVGVELLAKTATALPVVAVSGTPAGADEHSYPLPPADGVTIDRDTQVILVRLQSHVYAFNLACPHENTALRWRENKAQFQCPRHESLYQPDGTFVSGRATRHMDRFAVRRAGDKLIVDLARLFRSDQQAEDWSRATVAL
jgi:nitrite reductase/ring-hydroxylating ferredoxin subunit